MEMSQERTIAAPRDRVWASLMDPDVLKDCIPGCQELTGNADDGFEAVVTQKVGPVKATFKGEVKVTDRNEPSSARLEGSGKGGPAGFANGAAKLTLDDLGGGRTRLSYDVEANVGGKLAQLGGRIIDAFAKRMADQFFQSFQDRVEAGSPAQADADTAPVDTGEAAGDPVEPKEPKATMSPKPESKPEPQQKKGWIARLLGR